MSVRNHKRSTRYVNSFLQGHLMWRMVIYWLVYNAALILVIGGEKLVWLVPDLITGELSFNFGEFFATFFVESRTLLVSMAVFCPLLIWDMMKYSHRIAGPLYRFRKAMEDHLAGEELQAVTLRDDDLLKEFQLTFNEFVAHVQKQQSPEQPSEESLAELQTC